VQSLTAGRTTAGASPTKMIGRPIISRPALFFTLASTRSSRDRLWNSKTGKTEYPVLASLSISYLGLLISRRLRKFVYGGRACHRVQVIPEVRKSTCKDPAVSKTTSYSHKLLPHLRPLRYIICAQGRQPRPRFAPACSIHGHIGPSLMMMIMMVVCIVVRAKSGYIIRRGICSLQGPGMAELQSSGPGIEKRGGNS
jgi:hypothetical protein